MTTATPSPAAPAAPLLSLTPLFARLKLTLLRNGLRQSNKRKAVFIASIVLVALFGALQLLGLVALRGTEHVAAFTVPLTVLLALGWAVMPLFFPGGDETLDPTRLAMLPLRPAPLIAALLVSSLIGIGPAFTLLILIGSVIATAHGAAAFAVAVPAVLLTLLVCVALTRAVATANVRLLSSRKGKDLALLSGVIIGVGAQLVNLAVQKLSEAGLARLEPVADVTRWIPPGSALDAVRAAGEGEYGLAAAELALTAALLAVLTLWWQRTLTKVMTSPDSSTLVSTAKPEKERGAGAGLARLLPAGRTGTAAQRQLRYAWRDPKIKTTWGSTLGIGVAIPLINIVQGSHNLYFISVAVIMLTGLMYNQFGQDGPAFWMVLQAIGSPRDALAELRGRALALTLITVPYLLVLVLAMAVITGRWDQCPEVLGLSLAALGGFLGTGAIASVQYPYSVPQDHAFKNIAPGQSGIAWLGTLWSLVGLAVCAPLIGLTIGLHLTDGHGLLWTVLPLGVVYGPLAAWAGLRFAAPRMARRLPEILDAASKA
ncbi:MULTISPECIES: transporter [Streptomyces]|uniref:transporter n=1 Tax=Streptomyces TaxID=1883 RepID=UPI00163BFE90|nr:MULTISPECIES: transporter [Streptomyces]MBC2874812.1 transporter [Streptomyces sp. TYQ1024]UBI37264.1 transporter [Streptomyces mobaraensis]UKW29856.1 transporter [Streptomyces sp. TYQ1024]